MDSNNNNSLDSISNEHITCLQELDQLNRVRQQFLEKVAKEPKRFYPQDVDLVNSNDWWTLRFVKWNRGNEEKALKQMVTAFKWRKSFGLHDRTVNDIPNEFAKAAAIFPHGHDYKGRPIIYLRVKVYRKIQQLNLFFQQFVTGIVNHVDMESGRKGYVFVFDVTGMGMINIDFDFLKFLISLLQSYYPYGLRYAICYNVPNYLRPLWSMAKIFLGSTEKTFRFCTSVDELKKYIPEESLLRYMGGECDFDFTDFEEVRGAPSVSELAPKFGFSQAEVDKYFKIFESSIAEAKLLSRGTTVWQTNTTNNW